MRFLLDENVEQRIRVELHGLGHDVTALGRDYRSGISDEAVLAIARKERRTLVTNDLDFGELIVRRRLGHHGVILFRLPAGDTGRKVTALNGLLAAHPQWMREFVVISAGGSRRRRT